MDTISPSEEVIASNILLIRGQKVMLDTVLAQLYGVETKTLNQAVKRNPHRFPKDFMFQLSEEEWENLRSQIVTSSWGGRRYLPNVFTEHGAVMLASVLNSTLAVEASLFVVRAFVSMRSMMAAHLEINRKLQDLEDKYDGQFAVVFDALRQIVTPRQEPRERIGFGKQSS